LSFSALKQPDSTFEQFLESVPDAIVGVERGGEISLVNRQAEALFGYDRDQLLGQKLEQLIPDRYSDIHPEHRDGYFAHPRTRPMGAGIELFAVRKDGSEFLVEISLSSIETGEGLLAIAAVRDVSDRAENERERALSGQLNKARRLESVGQLAGGIAHDFNNLLGVIMNYAEFVGDELDPESPARDDVEEIRRAAERAAALTRQLLIFSRRDVVKPEVLDLEELVSGLENLLQRALGERVHLETHFEADLSPIEADSGQIEQVLVNLAVNARDAMPEGGRLLIEADNVILDEEYTYMHPDTQAGPYIRIKVSDAGVGMDDDVIQRAFEPFYTTKGKAEGTGLGLATVYGIVTHAGGRIDIYSEPGIGTTVKIHLPASSAPPTSTAAKSATGPPTGRGEVVLVVEDEPEVRRMAQRMLTKGSYTVIIASGGEEAISICERDDQRLDLMLTDVIMPGLLGPDLVEKVRVLRPGLGVVFMSGYSHQVLAPETLADLPAAEFIEKPFNADKLLRTVRRVLDAADAE
jgi:PAS domain S-box-containing protein